MHSSILPWTSATLCDMAIHVYLRKEIAAIYILLTFNNYDYCGLERPGVHKIKIDFYHVIK